MYFFLCTCSEVNLKIIKVKRTNKKKTSKVHIIITKNIVKIVTISFRRFYHGICIVYRITRRMCHDNVVKVVDEGDISCLDKRLKIRCVELYEIVPHGAIPQK